MNGNKTDYKVLTMKKLPSRIKNIVSYRVIYGDTDQMGVVYYANYLRWFENGRSEFLRQLGLPYATIEHEGFHFPVVEVSCSYAQPARYDDLVQIETELAELGRASLTFVYRIWRDHESCAVATGMTRHACTNRAGRVTRMPKIVLDALAAAAL